MIRGPPAAMLTLPSLWSRGARQLVSPFPGGTSAQPGLKNSFKIALSGPGFVLAGADLW